MLLSLAITWVLCAPAPAVGYRARTADDVRIDREIGDGNGWVDPQEAEVATAAHLVYQSTGMLIRPKLVTLRSWGGLATYEGKDRRPRVYINRRERPAGIRFVVFHEAGHIARRDPLSRAGTATTRELGAIEYAGRLIASTGSDIYAALVDIRRRHSPIHGTPEQRVEAMVRGYLAAGGTWNVASAQPTRSPTTSQGARRRPTAAAFPKSSSQR